MKFSSKKCKTRGQQDAFEQRPLREWKKRAWEKKKKRVQRQEKEKKETERETERLEERGKKANVE